MSQTTYNDAPDVAQAGQPYSANTKLEVIGAVCIEDIPFGRFVKDNHDGSINLPSTSGDDFLGVALRTQRIESLRDGSAPHYLADTEANVLRKGAIYVYCEEAFDPATDTLFVRYTANGDLLPGMVRTDADSGKAVAYAKAHRVLNTLTGAGLLAVEINLPA